MARAAAKGLTATATILVLTILAVSVVAGFLVLNHAGLNRSNTEKLPTKPPSAVQRNQTIENYVAGPGCQNFTKQPLNLSHGNGVNLSIVAFLMKSGTSATVCVSYPVIQPVKQEADLNFTSFIYAISYNSTTGLFTTTPAKRVNITADPTLVVLHAGANISEIVVNYTITASSQATGFYSLNYYNRCPEAIPLAVGYGTEEVNATDFSALSKLDAQFSLRLTMV